MVTAAGVVAMALSTQVTISTEQVDLLSVAGQLDNTGLTQLRRQLELLVDTGTVCLVVDLARVISCDHRLFDVLALTHQFLAEHQGWMRLVGIGPAVVNALDEAGRRCSCWSARPGTGALDELI
jgi:anti-anti-sigma regulatory factor